MDFSVTDELAAHRDAARQWVVENVRPAWVDEQYQTGVHQTMELHRLLARDGILGAGWPAAHGGTEVVPQFARALHSEISRFGLAADGWSTTLMVINTIDEVGTESQKREYIGGALRGEVLIALGYTEPESGSDVAAAKTTAVRNEAGWVINGQKLFTSTAQCCSHVFVLARTNSAVPKHRGLSLFLVRTDDPGFDLRPIHTLGGQQTCATYYSDVQVPDSALIGGVDDGWRVMKVALVHERGSDNLEFVETRVSSDLARWARGPRDTDGTTPLDDPLVAERIGRMAVDEEVARLLALQVRATSERGEAPAVEGAMAKLFRTEAAQRHHSDALDILGADGILAPGAVGAPDAGLFEAGFRSAVVETIRGGSSEILREIIAERRLGLPRTRPRQ
ncbi:MULTISPECIES: acyl-CoA dehydrogenase family protein [unclassified Frankia]|uniref:acyl-CoA dehydrogenase family protein n=1 Tax=unclassified Frankia TaxID=2632575 RepID=UPI0027DACDD5|nr:MULTISPECIES: acyl-CoA dehydrogenase family protein [unclassified Frankia]